MFCGKCGNKNEGDKKFCGACGAPVGQVAVAQKSAGGEVAIGPIKINASDEDNAILSVSGKNISAKFIFKLSAVLLTIAFFMPMFSIQIRMFGVTAGETMNGWTTAFGADGAGTFIAIFLLLMPISIFVLFQFKSQLEAKFAFFKGKQFTLASIGFVLGLILLFIVRSSVNSTFRGNISVSAGFVLSFLFYLIAGAIAVGCYLSASGKNIKIGASGNKASANVEAASADGTPVAGITAQASVPKPVVPFAPLPIQISAIFMGVSVVLLVAFFLNWVVVDLGCDLFGIGGLIPGFEMPSMIFTFSGFNLAFGSDEIHAMSRVVPLLFIPIVLLALFPLQKTLKLNSKVLFVVSTAAYILGIVLLVLTWVEISDEFFGDENMGIGFIITAVVYLLGVIASILFLVKSKSSQASGGVAQ